MNPLPAALAVAASGLIDNKRITTGNAIEGYTLRKALVLVRHGDRTPWKENPIQKLLAPSVADFEGLWASKLPPVDTSARLSSLFKPLLSDTMRKGSTGPVYAQLTALGVDGITRVGHTLRQRYARDLGLLGNTPDPNKIRVRSTNAPRTIMTAQCVLLGLFPWAVANVENVPGSGRPLLEIDARPDSTSSLSHADTRCPRAAALPTPSLESLFPGPALLPYTRQLENEIMAATGVPLSRLGNLHDTMHCLAAHGLPLAPPLGPAHLALIESRRAIDRRAKYISNKDALRLDIGPLLRETLLFLTDVNNPVVFDLIAGHDTQLVPLLIVLSAFPGDAWPEYGASLAFELWEPREGEGSSTGASMVQVVLNSEKVLCKLPLHVFVECIAPFVPKDYEADCALPPALPASSN